MHVLHFCATSVEGDYFRNLANGLVKKGVTVSLVELGAYKPPSWLEEGSSVRYFNLGSQGKAGLLAAAIKLVRLMRREKVDILHSHLYEAGLVSMAANAIYKKPVYVYMRHHTSVVRMLGRGIHVKLDKLMAERADHRLTVSNAAKAYMRDVDDIRKPIDVIHIGFDFDKFAPDPEARKTVREEFGFDEADIVVGYVGTFAPGKGHPQLAKAFTSAAKHEPRLRLLFLGSGDMRETRDIIDKAGLSDKVVWAGWRNDTPACLNAMDIFVQPSLSEAFSQVLIEAMGTGLPVIATTVGEAKDVISHDETGILIDPDSPDQIAEALKRVIADPSFRERLSLAARVSVRSRYDSEPMVTKHYDLYLKWMRERYKK